MNAPEKSTPPRASGRVILVLERTKQNANLIFRDKTPIQVITPIGTFTAKVVWARVGARLYPVNCRGKYQVLVEAQIPIPSDMPLHVEATISKMP